jgi:Protein of unknown function (DUF1592)/Protein of unknown function (DUF1588)/Protein of unknown function (DUF1595)/Protein of unknown function (DUF1585)/Protein of unknown function (DUF1587)
MKFRFAQLFVLAVSTASLAACTGKLGGSESGSTGAGGDGDVGAAGEINLAGHPQYYRFIRLTNSQWARSVQDILGLDTPSGLETGFQAAVAGTTDFTNNELVLDVTERAWGDFQVASEKLAAQVTASDATLAKVYPGTDGAGFIAAFGRRAYRRPLSEAEKSTYLSLFNSGSTLSGPRSNYAKGASLVIRAMLQSPFFLYRSELGATGAPLDAYEMAAKLSLWLRDTTPSDTLLNAAALPGNLDTASGAVALATTMVEEGTATAVMRKFHGEMLHFDRYGTISKLNVPTYKESLNAEFEESSYLFFDRIFAKGLGVKDILTSTSGFVGPGMAPIYGADITAPASGFAERDLGATRVGYFTQLPFLALYGFNDEPDTIHRGVSMINDVLCAKIGPPATVLPAIPALKEGQTNRQRISTLTASCGGSCHNENINPLGFAFEHFDGMGQYRDVENGGLKIDSKASFAFAEGTQSYSDAAELMQELAAGEQVHKCYAKRIASFGLQRDIVAVDTPLLESLTQASMASDGSVKKVILDLVKDDAFRTRVGGAQ